MVLKKESARGLEDRDIAIINQPLSRLIVLDQWTYAAAIGLKFRKCLMCRSIRFQSRGVFNLVYVFLNA